MDFIYYAIVANTNFVKRVIPFHFCCIWCRKIFRKAIYFFCDTLLVNFRNFFERLCSSLFKHNPVCQSSSSFFNSSHGIGSLGSFFAFQASSISILSSNSCKSLSSLIETSAAIGSPRRVSTNDSSPKATRLIIFDSIFLASAVVILFSIGNILFLTRSIGTNCTYCIS